MSDVTGVLTSANEQCEERAVQSEERAAKAERLVEKEKVRLLPHVTSPDRTTPHPTPHHHTTTQGAGVRRRRQKRELSSSRAGTTLNKTQRI